MAKSECFADGAWRAANRCLTIAAMSETVRRRWSRDETAAVLALYCQLSFGKMHRGNPDVKAVASKLDRSPSSVALKLVNFASLDPEHQRRGIKGMGNVSELDRQVWSDYYGDWDRLVEYALEPVNPMEPMAPPAAMEAMVAAKARRGQSFFRRSVCSAYDDRCCITGIATRELLRASHIIPWAVSAQQRLDPTNGLSLNALHDAAFDRGLITLDTKLQVVLSSRLKPSMPGDIFEKFFQQYSEKPITVPTRFFPKPEYLDYHRKHVFL